MAPRLGREAFTPQHRFLSDEEAFDVAGHPLAGDLARICEGSQDHPFGPYVGEIPPRQER